MNLSELQKKDIINMENGNNLGRIVDALIDESGQIIKFATEPKKIFKRVLRNNESTIDFTSIVKIGTDVILVK